MVTWTLDTCGFNLTTENCTIEVDNNFEFIRFIRKCPAHVALPDNSTGFNQIYTENTRGPSNVLWELLQSAPSGAVDIPTTGSNSGTRTWKAGINLTWSWSGTAPNRTLTVTITGLTLNTSQQNALRNKVDTRFGPGVITINFA